ncbi:MAG TPA: hypothetical protein VGF26_08275 [Ramlibacter sp.]
MQMQRVVLVLAMAAACVAAPARAAQPMYTYEEAVTRFRAGEWADAYGRFMDLANKGDADAARITLFMLRYGPQLHGSYWHALPHEVRRWQGLASSGVGRKSPEFAPALYADDQ